MADWIFYITDRKWDEDREPTHGHKYGHHRQEGGSFGQMKQLSKGNYNVTRGDIHTFLRRLGKYDRIVVFIHGYNNNIHEAADRVTQLHRALLEKLKSTGKRDVACVLFSWPSEGHELGKVHLDNALLASSSAYSRDKKRVRKSAPFFAQQLDSIRGLGKQVIVMGHSMGGNLVWKMKPHLSHELPKFKLLWIAADVSVRSIKRSYEAKLQPLVSHASSYWCDNDKALDKSRKYHHNHFRLGLWFIPGNKIPGIEYVEVPTSIAKRDKNRHTYFDAPEMQEDIFHQVFDSARNLPFQNPSKQGHGLTLVTTTTTRQRQHKGTSFVGNWQKDRNSSLFLTIEELPGTCYFLKCTFSGSVSQPKTNGKIKRQHLIFRTAWGKHDFRIEGEKLIEENKTDHTTSSWHRR